MRHPIAPGHLGLRARLLALTVMLVLVALPVGSAFAATSADYAISGGWFFTQTGGGSGQGFAVRDAGTDSSGHVIKYWSEFKRLGGVPTLGYPVGQPYVGSDGFSYQPFQRGVLQWRPELDRAVLSNTFEILQAAGRDDWLFSAKGIPRPISDDGSGGNFQKAVATRLGWMTNAAIQAKFLANPNPAAMAGWSQDQAIQLYGLPMSQPEQHGPFVSERFQRIAFQLWTDTVPGMPAPGTVVGILGGDLLKEAGQLPAAAIVPLGPNGTAPSQPTPAPQPAPSAYPWHVSNVQGVNNCGTAYVHGLTLNPQGLGVNGMAVKSWNDYGNVNIAGSHNYNGQDGYYDRIFQAPPQPGTWYVQVVDGAGNPASNTQTITITANCDPSKGPAVQQVEVDFQQS